MYRELHCEGAQTIAAATYNNLTLSGSGLKTVASSTTVTVNGTLTMGGTATATVTGTLSYGTAATLQYAGTAAQTTGAEFPSTWSGSGGVKINNASGVTLNAIRTISSSSSLTIGNSVANSIFNDGGYQLTCTGTLNLNSGTFKLGSSSTATTFPAFGTLSIAAGTTIEYAAGASQRVSATPSYQNLTVSGGGTKTLAARLR